MEDALSVPFILSCFEGIGMPFFGCFSSYLLHIYTEFPLPGYLGYFLEVLEWFI